VRLDVRLAPQPLTVSGDGKQVKQVVLNLVLNGMDAMGDQPPENRILTMETAEREDGWRTIVIQDSGSGFPDGALQASFQPFISTKPNGLGMGLAICSTIAEAHRGTIGFEPCDKGARAVLALPPA
jgi:C4-dicarboxylate-specific signal transduction histidine kinase